MAKSHIKEGKGINCKLLITCLQPNCQERKILNIEKQNLREEMGTKTVELLSLKSQLLQKPLQEEKKQKLEERSEAILTQSCRPPDILLIRKPIASPEGWDRSIWGDPVMANHGRMVHHISQIYLNAQPDPSLKQYSLKDLHMLCDTICKLLPRISQNWWIYLENTAENQVKLEKFTRNIQQKTR